jgi:hypothetical protein
MAAIIPKLTVLVGSIPGICEPLDETTIWQYMDFTKLVSILERKELFFARLEKVDDPYEGTTPNFNRRERLPTYTAQHPELTSEEYEKIFADTDNYLDQVRSGRMLINCWHMNPFESAAMWDLYAQRNSGIAIKTTLKRLKESLGDNTPDRIKLGLVKYIDFENEWVPEDNLYHFFLHKRRSFEHEKELRALLQLPIEGPTVMVRDGRNYVEDVRDTSDPKQKTKSGKYVTVDVDTLISNIYVAPRAPSWVGELVRLVAVRYGLNREQVIISDLYSLK